MPGQTLGTPFLERIMRKGKKQNALLNVPQSGGMGLPSPTGVGSGQKPPPRKPPAAAAQIAPVGGGAAPAPTAPAEPMHQPQQPPIDQMPLPLLDEEFPADSVDGEQMLGAGSLNDRFYRVYGRSPSEVDMYILNIRRQFEQKRGRPPSKQDILEATKRITESREVRPI